VVCEPARELTESGSEEGEVDLEPSAIANYKPGLSNSKEPSTAIFTLDEDEHQQLVTSPELGFQKAGVSFSNESGGDRAPISLHFFHKGLGQTEKIIPEGAMRYGPETVIPKNGSRKLFPVSVKPYGSDRQEWVSESENVWWHSDNDRQWHVSAGHTTLSVREPYSSIERDADGNCSITATHRVDANAYRNLAKRGDVRAIEQLYLFDDMVLLESIKLIELLRRNIQNLSQLLRHALPAEAQATAPFVYVAELVDFGPSALVVVAPLGIHLPAQFYWNGGKFHHIDRGTRQTKRLWRKIIDLNNSPKKIRFDVLKVENDLRVTELTPNNEEYCDLDEALDHKSLVPHLHDAPSSLCPTAMLLSQIHAPWYTPRAFRYLRGSTTVRHAQPGKYLPESGLEDEKEVRDAGEPHTENGNRNGPFGACHAVASVIPDGQAEPIQIRDPLLQSLMDATDGNAASAIADRERKKADRKRAREREKELERRWQERAAGKPSGPEMGKEDDARQSGSKTPDSSNDLETDEESDTQTKAHSLVTNARRGPTGTPLRNRPPSRETERTPREENMAKTPPSQASDTSLLTLHYSDSSDGEYREVLTAREALEKSRQKRLRGEESTDTDEEIVVGKVCTPMQPPTVPVAQTQSSQGQAAHCEITKEMNQRFPFYFKHKGQKNERVPDFIRLLYRLDQPTPPSHYISQYKRHYYRVDDPKELLNIKRQEVSRYEKNCKRNLEGNLQATLHKSGGSLEDLVSPRDPLDAQTSKRKPRPKSRQADSSADDFEGSDAPVSPTVDADEQGNLAPASPAVVAKKPPTQTRKPTGTRPKTKTPAAKTVEKLTKIVTPVSAPRPKTTVKPSVEKPAKTATPKAKTKTTSVDADPVEKTDDTVTPERANQTTLKDHTKEAPANPASGSAETEKAVEVPLKRKRGRPRKVPQSTANAVTYYAQSMGDDVDNQVLTSHISTDSDDRPWSEDESSGTTSESEGSLDLNPAGLVTPSRLTTEGRASPNYRVMMLSTHFQNPGWYFSPSREIEEPAQIHRNPPQGAEPTDF
jgi:hypothetical protein